MRFTVCVDGDAVRVKSAGGVTVRVTLVVCVSVPLVAVMVMG